MIPSLLMKPVVMAAGVAVAVGLGYVWWLGEVNAEQEKLLLQAQRNLHALREEMTQHRNALDALQAANARQRDRLEDLRNAREEAIDAPDADDAPVAPVLDRALERLRQAGAGDGVSPS